VGTVNKQPFSAAPEQKTARSEPVTGPNSGTFASDDPRAILEALPIGVFVVTLEGEPHYVNAYARRMMGDAQVFAATLKTLAEQNKVRRRSTGRAMTWPEFPIARALRGEFTVDHDIEVSLPQRTVPLGVYAGPLEDEHGCVRYAIATFADLTKQDVWDGSHEELENR
jgi:PAS domain-containing protein